MSAYTVLASNSLIRRQILIEAGLDVDVVSPGVDEDAIKTKMASSSGEEVARALAEAKARTVSLRRLSDLVVGADQVLRFQGRLFDKALSMDKLEDRLKAMRGQTHELISAVAVARAGEIRHVAVDVAKLRMRRFSDAFLRTYLERAGEGILSSVGGYEYETLGVHLFEAVEGDFYTILGLPLLPLLAALRAEGVLPT
jgi:septum formation protein